MPSLINATAARTGVRCCSKLPDERLGLSEALAACLRDRRAPEKIVHSMHDLLRQRVYGFACGYEDCNDAGRLMGDPIHRLLLDRDPVQGEALASQPTLSRFENGVDVRSLERMAVAPAECVIARHRKRLKKRVRRITIDLDPTDDPTYGQQQLTFFNTHYGNWCYLPMAGFLQFDEEPDQYLFGYVLCPGDAHASYGAIAILRRVIKRLRAAFRGVKISVVSECGQARCHRVSAKFQLLSAVTGRPTGADEMG